MTGVTTRTGGHPEDGVLPMVLYCPRCRLHPRDPETERERENTNSATQRSFRVRDQKEALANNNKHRRAPLLLDVTTSGRTHNLSLDFKNKLTHVSGWTPFPLNGAVYVLMSLCLNVLMSLCLYVLMS